MRGEAEYVSCFGSGTIAGEMHAYYGSPFAVETCHIKLKDSDLAAQVIRSLFDIARQYREIFEVYGSKNPSNGRSSNTIRWSFTPPNCPNRKSRAP